MGNEVRRLLRAAQDLEQYGDGRRVKSDFIDKELCVCGVLSCFFRVCIFLGRNGVYPCNVQIDVDVSTAYMGFTWLDHDFVGSRHNLH
jgi:hypothetical protein